MNLKDNVLKYLETNRNEYVSGEQIAEMFDVSRSAVWKVMEKLRQEGHEIEAATKKGYRLTERSDVLSAAGIAKYLSAAGNTDESRIRVFAEVDSTNNVAKEMALHGAPHGTVILAEHQTAGRGRLGREFESPAGTGIYMTMILRPDADMRKALLITTAASVGVCRAIRSVTGAEAVIKWVNDIYLEEKKLCGILSEAVTDFELGTLESVVVGIGINFREPEGGFSPKVAARSIGTIYGTAKPRVTRNQLAARIIDDVLEVCSDLEDRTFLEDYRKWSIVIGREVLCIQGQKRRQARVLDIGESGGLIVLYSDGTREELTSGEISIHW